MEKQTDKQPSVRVRSDGRWQDIPLSGIFSDWVMAAVYDPDNEGKHPRRLSSLVCGVLVEDFKGRFPANSVIHTSKICEKLGEGLYRTRNSVYLCEGRGRLLYLPRHMVDYIFSAENKTELDKAADFCERFLNAGRPPENLPREPLFSSPFFVAYTAQAV